MYRIIFFQTNFPPPYCKSYLEFITKLSHNVCLLNIHILIYWHARYPNKLWNAYWFYSILANFAHIWRIFMSEVLYIHQTFTVVMPDLTTSGFFGNFNVWYVIVWKEFQRVILPYVIACYKSVYSIKINLCNNLWLRQSSFFFHLDLKLKSIFATGKWKISLFGILVIR